MTPLVWSQHLSVSLSWGCAIVSNADHWKGHSYSDKLWFLKLFALEIFCCLALCLKRHGVLFSLHILSSLNWHQTEKMYNQKSNPKKSQIKKIWKSLLDIQYSVVWWIFESPYGRVSRGHWPVSYGCNLLIMTNNNNNKKHFYSPRHILQFLCYNFFLVISFKSIALFSPIPYREREAPVEWNLRETVSLNACQSPAQFCNTIEAIFHSGIR